MEFTRSKFIKFRTYFSLNCCMILSEVSSCLSQICSLKRSLKRGCSSRSVVIYSATPAVFRFLNSSGVIIPSFASRIFNVSNLKNKKNLSTEPILYRGVADLCQTDGVETAIKYITVSFESSSKDFEKYLSISLCFCYKPAISSTSNGK